MFIAMKVIAVVASALHATPSYMVFLHAVNAKDQSFAIGFRNAIRKLLGWMPTPLYFGMYSSCGRDVVGPSWDPLGQGH